jgi:hypothetical protein
LLIRLKLPRLRKCGTGPRLTDLARPMSSRAWRTRSASSRRWDHMSTTIKRSSTRTTSCSESRLARRSQNGSKIILRKKSLKIPIFHTFRKKVHLLLSRQRN